MATITTGTIADLMQADLMQAMGNSASAMQTAVFNNGFTGTGQVYAEPPKVYKNDVEKAIADIVAELRHDV